MEILPLLSLVYGDLLGHVRDFRAFRRALHTATSFSVIGADVMDGGYGYGASTNRANLARRTAEVGIDTRILGFSWNASPDPTAARAVRDAAARGVTTILRDPRSATRARADGIQPVVDGADLVFLARSVDETAAAAWAGRVAAPLALVNFSGLVPSGGGLEPYIEVVRALRERGHGVLSCPTCRALAPTMCPSAARSPISSSTMSTSSSSTGSWSPSTIRGLTRRARITVTGRMHLAVMSLMHGVPAVTVATQGKVEGLMDLFGTPGLCVPTDELASSLAAVTAETADAADVISARIRERIGGVAELAAQNFAGLAQVDRTVTSA